MQYDESTFSVWIVNEIRIPACRESDIRTSDFGRFGDFYFHKRKEYLYIICILYINIKYINI